MVKGRCEQAAGKSLLDRRHEVVLKIGKDEFDRLFLAKKIGCTNPVSAVKLNRILRQFKPKSVRELARRIDVYDLRRVSGVGETTVFVWMQILEHVGVDPLAWLDSEKKLSTICSSQRK